MKYEKGFHVEFSVTSRTFEARFLNDHTILS
jgi:hypothetical protein